MRLDRFDLTRFGPFTNVTLDLSAPGVHLIRGRNESGKTTMMAAVHQLLFEIPTRTRLDFVHEKRDLRLAALVANEEGKTLEIVRVKKRSDTLQDQNGNTLDEDLLTKLLHDVSADVYGSLFNIGHDEIASGGEALLESEGELARALFSASRGTTDLTSVLRRLDVRAGELFKSSASVPKLNAAIREYKETSSEARRLSKSASKVTALDAEVAAAAEEHEQLSASRKKLSARRTRLDRVRSTRPLLAKRIDVLTKLSDLKARGPLVKAHIRSDLEEAARKGTDGEAAHRAAVAAIERLDKKLANLEIDTNLLEQQETIESLTRQSGGYDQNETDLPGLQARANTAERELTQLRKRLPDRSPADDGALSGLTVDEEQQIRRLMADSIKLDNDLKHAFADVDDTTISLGTLRDELNDLDEPADVATLAKVTARVRKAGDLEDIRTNKVRSLESIDHTLSSELAWLGLGDVDRRAVDALAVPAIEIIRRHRSEFGKRADDISRLEEQIDQIQSRRGAADDDLAQLLRSEEPPSIDDLSTSRSHRDEGWHLIRITWLGEPEDRPDMLATWSGGQPLQDAYEAAVETADDIADRLHREAHAVERRAALEQSIDDVNTELETHNNSMNELHSAGDAAEADWIALWEAHGIAAQSPADMEAWHDTFKECAQQSREFRALDGEIADLDSTIARNRQDLEASIASVAGPAAPDLSLLGLVDAAEQIVAAAAEAQQQYEKAKTACKEAEARLKKHNKALARATKSKGEWEKTWSSAVTSLGLAAAASVTEANAVLDALAELFTTTIAHEDFKHRILGIEQRSQEFTDGITLVLGSLKDDQDLADADPATAVKMLSRRVKAAQKVATKSAAATEERESHEALRADTELLVAESEQLINEMVTAASVANRSELLEALARSEEHAHLLAQIGQLEDNLRDVAGKPLDEIEAEAQALADSEIEPEIQEIDLELEDFDHRLKEKQTRVGELTHERSLIDSSGEAADLMTEAQQALASVIDYADEYVQTVLARRLLEEQVIAYRDEHQGPLLERARELFRSLTLGRYRGLDTDTDDKGNPFLVARTSDERLLTVDALSTGTRDQLYLALRLAALEQFINRRGPLPLVLDDLFVHFDDERTAAGLAVLDQIANTTQVLLFTHHDQVALQAAEVINPDRLTVHELM